MASLHDFFLTAPRGTAELLAAEVRALGGREVHESATGVRARGALEFGYRACLWSRVANRVLLRLRAVAAPDAERLYRGVRAIAWEEHLAPTGTLAVAFTGTSRSITNSHFGALRVKDAIVDRFRERAGVRPSVSLERPDLRVNVHLYRDSASVSLDLSGESLHRRGYREAAGAAPLKENLAAAILLLAGWPGIARAGGPLVDPMCGSGTIPIEAALMAADIAPGLVREQSGIGHWGFLRWSGHDAELWRRLVEEARARRTADASVPLIRGRDTDPAALDAARAAAARAGVSALVGFEQRELAEGLDPGRGPAGLVVVNPPYGERLGDPAPLGPLYRTLGRRLRGDVPGWRAAVLTSDAELGAEIGLRPRRAYRLWNGAIACRLLCIEVAAGPHAGRTALGLPGAPGGRSSADMFADRLRKNLRTQGRWARREGIHCYRLYDADMPEFALAVDLYRIESGGEALRAHVQEYAPPAGVRPSDARARLEQALAVIPQVLDIPAAQVSFRVRRRQRAGTQYERAGGDRHGPGALHPVVEGGCRFLVNFGEYIDTGLFLDHRPTRALLCRLAAGGRFLNLFAYTATATVCAAAGGARSTTSVDLSATYLDWARRNLELNGFKGARHELIQADVLRWLPEQAGGKRRYDLVFLDPPTFSNSKRMRREFDVQRDHPILIGQAARLLAPGGVLVFSTHARRFRLRPPAPGLAAEEITRETIPRDFARNPRIHRCWKMTPAPGNDK